MDETWSGPDHSRGLPAVSYAAADLSAWIEDVFAAAGLQRAEASEGASALVRTSLRGIDTHGVARVPEYVERVLKGRVNRSPRMTSELRGGALVFDGDGGLGQAVAIRAVDAACTLARDSASVSCVIRRCGHLAALGHFVLEAAERGMVAMLCQNTPPLMAMAGSPGRSIGNNPLAFAAPVRDAAPLVFDIAASVVARGVIHEANRNGAAEIPEGWALAPGGQPTIDPNLALQGAILPAAGHKGLGLAMMVQVLAGALSASEQGGPSSGMSAFLLLINPDQLPGRDIYDEQMAAWISAYRTGAGPAGRYPGEGAARVEGWRSQAGVPIPNTLAKDLRRTGDSVGVAFDLSSLEHAAAPLNGDV